MKTGLRCAGLLLLALAALSATAQQQNIPHAAFVYPAGGRQGTTFEVTVGGQFLDGTDVVYFAGPGLHAEVKSFLRPLNGKELQPLRDELETLEALRRDPPKAPAAATPAAAPSDKKPQSDAPPAVPPTPVKRPWTPEERKRAEELRSKIRETEQMRARPALSQSVILSVTIDANAPLGNHELRLATKEGLTSPLVFEVDKLPEFASPSRRVPAQLAAGGGLPLNAQAHADAFTAPTPVVLPIVLNGQLMPGSADRYRFHALRGEHLVIAAQTRSLIPFMSDAVPGWFQANLTLRDPDGHELASTDHFRFSQEPVIEQEIPADGDYLLEVRDVLNRGREDFVYRIQLGELPYVTGVFPLGIKAGSHARIDLDGWNLKPTVFKPAFREAGLQQLLPGLSGWQANPVAFAVGVLPESVLKAPAPTPTNAMRLKLPVVVNGRIAHPGDKAYFRIDAQAGQQMVAEVEARRLGSPLDSILTLSDAHGQQLAVNDDFDDPGSALLTHQADSRLTFRFPQKGRYYLQLADTEHNGGPDFAFRLRVSVPRPDFELRLLPSSIRLRAGRSTPIQVVLLRRDGFSGPVTLRLKDAPPGLELSGGEIPAWVDSVRLTLTAPPVSLAAPLSLVLEGEAQIDGRAVRHNALPADDQMQAFAWHRIVPAQQALLWSFPNENRPFHLPPFAGRVRIPPGGEAIVRIPLTPRQLLNHFNVTVNDAPGGISVASVDTANGFLQLHLRADAKIQPGLQGNLLLEATMNRAANPLSPAPPSAKPGAPEKLGILPALPFEIVGR